MSEIDRIAQQIQKIGFQCQRCGDCCRGGDVWVMIYPTEIRAIMELTSSSWECVAEPYPEQVPLPSGQVCTFEWALKKKGDRCIFLETNCCQIYLSRPWICRTYPFLLFEERLFHENCPGLGKEIGKAEAFALSRNLINRRETERKEEARVREHGKHLERVKGRRILIDGEGVKILCE
ncbi:MAG: YkgJ family cysteine cluster protein [Methanomicrobiales archaeon]|nr:YkgJ family cysteine cluster protein [Methanomicrobiales archaeon]